MPRYLCVSIVLFLAVAASAAAPLKLIPQPQSVMLSDGQFSFDKPFSINILRPDLADDVFAGEQLREELKRCLGISPTDHEGSRDIVIGALSDEMLTTCVLGRDMDVLKDEGPEAYLLTVTPDRIIAAGNSTAGTFYAVQTLKQLIRANTAGTKLPCMTILDWPELQYRGYSDDISRGPIPTMAFFKRQIRTMAEFKMNMLTFYTEHVFKLDKHPVIAPPDGITPEQVRELSQYARKHHVELVGNFQSFGHFGNILRHEEYAHLRETGSVITPAKEESYQFLDDVYSEIAPAYNSKLFNVNCDETWGLGDGPSKELAAEIGVGRVYLQHMNRIHDILKNNYGKRMMMWGDIALQHPEMIEDLAKDTILLSWGYGAAANYDRAIEPFVKAGLEFMVCPGVSCWSRIFPLYENAVVNIQNYVRDGAKFGAIGMLNTTWDDDGENLFHWNFYGTNWGAACAWRPASSDLDAYNEAYAQVSYGTSDDKITEAIHILASCAHNPLTRGNHDPAFYVRPFGALATSFDALMSQAGDLVGKTEKAIALLDEAEGDAKLDAEDIDYIRFAARRLWFIGRARELQLALARDYTEAVSLYPETGEARRLFDQACAAANENVGTLEKLRAEYARLWLAENRPWWLDRMLGRYDGLLNDLRAHAEKLAKARATFEETGVPPDPMTVGLQLVETSRRSVAAIPAKEPVLADNAKWWDDRWPYRIPLQVQGTKSEVTDFTVEVRVNFGKHDVDAASVRAVEYAQGGKPVLLATQFSPTGDSQGHVAFTMPGKLTADTARNFAIYFDTKGSAPKPPVEFDGIRLTTDGAGHWIENSEYKILIGSNGGHMFEWQVKALGGKDITEPGRGSWSGFADAGSERGRDAHFDIRAEASGPVMVRLKAAAPAAQEEKIFTFYANKPYVEVMLANPAGFYWDYDNAANFAKDKGNPGTAVFSNGHKEPVCASGEQIHAEAQGVIWGAKTRADGFVLANITPEVKGTHMTGPGGGWGGVGIERSTPAAHFVTFADVIKGDLAPVLNTVAATLDMNNQPRYRVGTIEARPEG